MPRNVTLTFSDGSQHVYQGVPDGVTPDQVEQRASTEFTGKKLVNINGGTAPAGQVPIPGQEGEPARAAAARAADDARLAARTPMDQAIGLGEAGLTAITGATGGAIGMVGGLGKGLAQEILSGQFGTPQANDVVAQAMNEGAAALTYAPRTPAGQQYAETLGNGMANLVPLAGMGGELAALGAAKASRSGTPARVLAQAGAEGAARDVAGLAARPAEAAGMVAPGVAGDAAAGLVARAGDSAAAGAGKLSDAAQQLKAKVDAAKAAKSQPVANGSNASVGAAAADPQNQARAIAAGASPELQATVEQAIKQGKPIDIPALSRHAEAESLPVKVRLTEGQATGNLELISDERNNRAKTPEFAKHFNEQDNQLKENLGAIREAATPDVYAQDPASHSDAIISAYKAKDDAARADIRAKYQALADANGGNLPIDSAAFVLQAERGLQKANRTRFVPPEVRGLLDDFKSGAPMTFDDFEQMRTILSAEARKAERAGDGNRAMAVSAVRNALEDLPMPAGRADLKPLADSARAAAKARFDAIKADPAYAAVVKDKALPDSFGNRYVVNADSTNVAKMMRGLAADPVAQQTLAAILIDHLSDRAGVRGGNGAFSQAGFSKALDKQSQKLQIVMPQQQANQLTTLANVARYVKEQPHGSWVNNSSTFVAQAGAKAAGTIENVANFAAHGVPIGTWARGAFDRQQGAAAFAKSTKPGAGAVKTKQQMAAELKAKTEAAKAAKKANQGNTP
jgi:hypothetical protein